jgi:hypothetical protein
MRSIILIGAVILNPQLFFAQPANLIIGSSSYFCEGANAYVHLPGDIRCDGVINMAASSVWNFEGSSSQQRITCASGTGCTDIYNTNNYLVRLGSVQQYH